MGVSLTGTCMRLAALLLVGTTIAIPVTRAANDNAIERLIAHELVPELLEDGIGGAAIAIRICGRTLFFNYGFADMASRRPITSDSLFNLASLRKVLEATLLAQAVQRGELRFDDPVATYVTELKAGGAIRDVTLGQLASHSSGLLLPSDHPPWLERGYTLDEFIGVLNAWTPPPGHRPGEAHTYTHAGYVLLQLALERRFGMPIGELLEQRILKPLGMTATILPARPSGGEPAPPLPGAVQGYGDGGEPIGIPGNQQGYYEFPGTGQIFSSARDLMTLVAANLGASSLGASQLGASPVTPDLRAAMRIAQRGVVRISPRVIQALAWEIDEVDGLTIVDKPGGLNNASAYIGMIPDRQIGIVILVNRGDRNLHGVARDRTLPALARLGPCER